jgi:filamentous hemagglutinin
VRPGHTSGGTAPSSSGGTVTYFRVQGGTPPAASRHLIHVDSAGNVTIHSGTLNVSAGTAEHARYFQQLRPGSRITTFEVPQWLDDFIRQEAIPQRGYRTNPLNQGGLAPKIVDPTTPGRSYELPSIWAEWLQEYAVPGSGRVLP